MFLLMAPDNGLYFLRDRPDVTRCSSCGALTKKWEEDLSSVPIPVNGRYDVSYSYDGVWEYDYQPEPGSPESLLYDVYLQPHDWANE